jgi:hypothetical protein
MGPKARLSGLALSCPPASGQAKSSSKPSILNPKSHPHPTIHPHFWYIYFSQFKVSKITTSRFAFPLSPHDRVGTAGRWREVSPLSSLSCGVIRHPCGWVNRCREVLNRFHKNNFFLLFLISFQEVSGKINLCQEFTN